MNEIVLSPALELGRLGYANGSLWTSPYGLHVARQHLTGPRADNPIEAVMAAHVAEPTG